MEDVPRELANEELLTEGNGENGESARTDPPFSLLPPVQPRSLDGACVTEP